MMTTITNKEVRWLMLEALRRYTRFHRSESLTKSWTGLGYLTQYKPAIKAGLMD